MARNPDIKTAKLGCSATSSIEEEWFKIPISGRFFAYR